MKRLREGMKREGSALENGRSPAIQELTRKFGALAISLATLVGSPDKAEASKGNLNDVTVKNSFVMSDTSNGLDLDEQGNMVEETGANRFYIVVDDYIVSGGEGISIRDKNTGDTVSFFEVESEGRYSIPKIVGQNILIEDIYNHIVYSIDKNKLGNLSPSDCVVQNQIDYSSTNVLITLAFSSNGELLWNRVNDDLYILSGTQYLKLSNPNQNILDLVSDAKSLYVNGMIYRQYADFDNKKIHVFVRNNDTGLATHYVNDQSEMVEAPQVNVEIAEGQKVSARNQKITFTVENMTPSDSGEVSVDDLGDFPFTVDDVDASGVVTIQLSYDKIKGIEDSKQMKVSINGENKASNMLEVDTKVIPLNVSVEDSFLSMDGDRLVVEREAGQMTRLKLENSSGEGVETELSVVLLGSMEEVDGMYNNESGEVDEQELRQLMGEASMVMDQNVEANGESTVELDLSTGLSVLIVKTMDDDGNEVFEFTFVESVVPEVVEDPDMGNNPDMSDVDMGPDMETPVEEDMSPDEEVDMNEEEPGNKGGKDDEPLCSIAYVAPKDANGKDAMFAALLMAMAAWRRRRKK